MVIEYNEDDVIMGSNRGAKSKKIKGLIGLMMRKGWVKSKSEANAILIIIIIILVITTIVIRNKTAESDSFKREPVLQNLPIEIQNKLSPAVKDLIR